MDPCEGDRRVYDRLTGFQTQHPGHAPDLLAGKKILSWENPPADHRNNLHHSPLSSTLPRHPDLRPLFLLPGYDELLCNCDCSLAYGHRRLYMDAIPRAGRIAPPRAHVSLGIANPLCRVFFSKRLKPFTSPHCHIIALAAARAISRSWLG